MADSESQKRVKAGKEMKQGFSWLNADFIHRRLSRRLSLTKIANQCFFLFVFNLSLFNIWRQNHLSDSFVSFHKFKLKEPQRGDG